MYIVSYKEMRNKIAIKDVHIYLKDPHHIIRHPSLQFSIK